MLIMDEVGFMIVEEDGDGLYEFEMVGGGDERQFVSKPVIVGVDKLPGVIGSKPIHLAAFRRDGIRDLAA